VAGKAARWSALDVTGCAHLFGGGSEWVWPCSEPSGVRRLRQPQPAMPDSKRWRLLNSGGSNMKKLVLAMTLAAVAVLTIQIQSAAACDFSKSAAYSQHSRHAHRAAAVHVANLQR
jgi:hypothetical protein